MSLKPPVSDKDHSQGPQSAPIELVEYGDYQCPHCGAAHPMLKKVLPQLGDKVRFIFRNFPLQELHPDAVNAAIAAEAGALQGKFWEMHDIIFEHQKALAAEHLFVYAEKAGLDVGQFAGDIQKDELMNRVQSDFESGVRSGVNGTPSFFINGAKYNGSWERDVFLAHLQSLVH